MKRTFTLLAALAAVSFGYSQNFTPGNVLVVRIGDHLDTIKATGSPVFLDEYNPSTKALVQSLAIPATRVGANKALILGGTATTEGLIQRSPSGKYVTLIGYDTLVGGRAVASTNASGVNRSIARVGFDKEINLTTGISDFGSGSPRDVISSDDGTEFWAVGASNGIRYIKLGATASVQISKTITNLRAINIADNKLYISTASGTAVRVGVVDTAGLAKDSLKTIVSLPGYPVTTSPYQFVFFDLDASVPGPDVLYVANDNNPNGGIQKYSLVAGAWAANGIVGTNADLYRGITGTTIAGGAGVTLYATRKAGSSTKGGGELVSILDVTGYNGAFVAIPNLIATYSDSAAFRGVSLTPVETALPLNIMSFTASKTGAGNLLAWTTNKEFNVSSFEVQKSIDGVNFTSFASQKANGSELYNEYSATDKTTYTGLVYYRLKTISLDGAVKYSNIIKISNLVSNLFTVRPNPAVSSITVDHPLVSGKAVIRIVAADGRQMAAYPVPDNSFQTSLNIGNLATGTYRVVFENGTTKKSTLLLKK